MLDEAFAAAFVAEPAEQRAPAIVTLAPSRKPVRLLAVESAAKAAPAPPAKPRPGKDRR